MKQPNAIKLQKKGRKLAGAALSAEVASPERLQYAALPWRNVDGLEIMLVSSRDTRRWIIPKGWPMAGRSGSAAAAIEAIEEAGLLGAICEEPIGVFSYAKRFSRNIQLCQVEVYSLRVLRQREHWPEMRERVTKWFPAVEAMETVTDPELCDLIGRFIRAQDGLEDRRS
jgi:8-oxo-dGTP pyrophosphatase MutT (NUDIX family)